jgi:SAM-dependent methyltransferase
MISIVKRVVPTAIKQKIKNHLAEKNRVRLFGDLASLVPAVEQMFDGPRSLEEFKANGEEFLKIYKELCGLRPDERMLDVGCGIGRKTVPLTHYFTRRAAYEGIDITKAGIDWCCERITPRFPNFRFQQIDVYNKLYNPVGHYPPSAYRFPFVDKSFSFVMLGSVFTHMLPDAVTNYLSEVHRVLETRGRCLISYFLLNEDSLRLMDSGNSTLRFDHVYERYRTISRDVPESAIAFEETWIRRLYEEVGLKLLRLDYGSWCGRGNHLSYQDLILATKE